MTTLSHRLGRPDRQAFHLLRAGFVLAPILFGLDKFFNFMVDWPDYLAPWLDDIVPGSGQELMYVVGVVEILAGLLVLFPIAWLLSRHAPRVGVPVPEAAPA